MAGIRQIVESVYDKLFNAFGLWRERPHELQGLRARLAARVALHNYFCICGSTINSVVPGWPSPTCWDGELTIHTKRLRAYSPECVEDGFCELRLYGVLRSSHSRIGGLH